MSEEKERVIPRTRQLDDVVKVLHEICDMQRQSLDRQSQFLWMLLPIFAVLCVQTILLLVR